MGNSQSYQEFGQNNKQKTTMIDRDQLQSSNKSELQSWHNAQKMSYDVSQFDTSVKVQNLTFGASQSGVKNSSESMRQDMQQSPQKMINREEFEFWRQKGNEQAVEALQNSDKLTWAQFKQKLQTALSHYQKTPSLSIIYSNVTIGQQQSTNSIQKYSFESRMALLTKLNNQNQSQGPSFNYLEEILRVSKNKSVCYRALIQNMYIQMQNNFDQNLDIDSPNQLQQQSQSTNELMKELLEYFVCFTENLNLNLLYVVDQLGQDPITKEIGVNFKNKSSKLDSSPIQNDAGPGGSPHTFQGLNSFQVTDSMSQSINQVPEIIKLKQLNSQRFIEILSSCNFIFQDKFIKNLLSNEVNLQNKIRFLEKIYEQINENNYDFLRKISFYLAKIYFKKSCQSHSDKNIQSSLHENQFAFLYLQRYKQFTQKIQENFILSEAGFLQNDLQTNLHPNEIEKFQQRIDNQQSMIRFVLSQTKHRSPQQHQNFIDKSNFSDINLASSYEVNKQRVDGQSQSVLNIGINKKNMNQRSFTPRVINNRQMIANATSKKPLKKVVTRRLSYYLRQQQSYQNIDQVQVDNKLNCFQVCYAKQIQQPDYSQQRYGSPSSSISCIDPSKFAFSEGDLHQDLPNQFDNQSGAVLVDYKSNQNSKYKAGRQNKLKNQSRDIKIKPFKVSQQNQNAMKLIEPKSGCEGSIISTLLGEDDLFEDEQQSNIGSNIINGDSSNLGNKQPVESLSQNQECPTSQIQMQEKNITKITVKKQSGLFLSSQNQADGQNNMIVNLEVKNSKQVPVYLRGAQNKKHSTQSSRSQKSQRLVSLNQYQKMQLEVNKLRLEKKLMKGNHTSYQQKMIYDRMRSKLIFKDQENALKNMHERQQRRLFPMKLQNSTTFVSKQAHSMSKISMLSNIRGNRVSAFDIHKNQQRKVARVKAAFNQEGPSKKSKIQGSLFKSIHLQKKSPKLNQKPNDYNSKPRTRDKSKQNLLEVSQNVKKLKVTRKKSKASRQREPWKLAIGQLERGVKSTRPKSQMSQNSQLTTQRAQSHSPQIGQRSVRKRRMIKANQLFEQALNKDGKSEFNAFAKNIYQTQKQVLKRKIEIQEQQEKLPIDIQIDVLKNQFEQLSAKSDQEQKDEHQNQDASNHQKEQNQSKMNTTRENSKLDILSDRILKKDRKSRKKRLMDGQNKQLNSVKAAKSTNNASDRDTRMNRNISNNIQKLNKRLNQVIQSPQNQISLGKQDVVERTKKSDKNVADISGDSKLMPSQSKNKLRSKEQTAQKNSSQQIRNETSVGSSQHKSKLKSEENQPKRVTTMNSQQDASDSLKQVEQLQQRSEPVSKRQKKAPGKNNAKKGTSPQSKGADDRELGRGKGKKYLNEHDFEPLRKLGRGSFGDVYLVRHVTHHSQPGPIYAMKTLSKKNNLEDSWIRYVKTERDVLAYSNNPFIVKLKYAFQTRKKLFLIIDFCPGGDLETLLSNENGPLDIEKARFYIAEILLALRDLHARNIIYRDLKPDNVVIDNEGHAQLIDFGMAKQDISEVQKGAKTFCGSVKYLAPEMLKKMGHGQALDWYLLGVLLYEMVVGVTPYFSSDKDVLFNNILYGKLKLPKGIDQDIKSLLISLLNRNPTKRLGSVSGDKGALEIMSHPFFNSIDWQALIQKSNHGQFAFWPSSPKYTTDDYQEAFPQTQLTKEQIYQIYYGDDNEDEDAQDKSDYDKEENSKNKAKKGSSHYYVYIDGWDYNRETEIPMNENMTAMNQNLIGAINLLRQQQQQSTDSGDLPQVPGIASKADQVGAAQLSNQQLTTISANGDMAPPMEYKPSVEEAEANLTNQAHLQTQR